MAIRRTVASAALVAVATATVVALSAGPDRHGARLVRFTIASRYVRRALTETAVVPGGGGAERRPLLVFLHGKTSSGGPDSMLTEPMFAALAGQGRHAPVVVFPDGDTDSYWHNRAQGAWGDYVMREVIPAAIARLHVDPRRIAIGGVSMGGFGALDLARAHPGRFCAVGGHSAALWLQAGDTAPGAFDDAQDFGRHDVIAAASRADPYPGVPAWLDVGTEDPFRAADTTLARELRGRAAAVQLRVWPGPHGSDYTMRHWGSYFAFYARALARCRP